MMELIYKLHRFLRQHRVDGNRIKITVEFLDPETQHRAEYMLRMAAQGTVFDRDMIECICEGRAWTMYGINMQVKKLRDPRDEYLPVCNCDRCKERRDAMR